jgi:hypothetical protein
MTSPEILTRHLDWYGTPQPLGRHVEHDERSRSFPAQTAPLPNLAIRWTINAAPLDQGNLGSCTGNAVAQCFNTTPYYGERRAFHKGRYLTEDNALAFYKRATEVDGFDGTYPPDDTGSSGLAAAKAAREAGYINSYTHAFGIDHVLGALAVGPLIVGTVWLDDMFQPDERGVLTVSGKEAGGHEYLLLGWNPKTELMEFFNSWGSSWGRKGHFYIPVDEFDRKLLQADGDATVLVGSVA